MSRLGPLLPCLSTWPGGAAGLLREHPGRKGDEAVTSEASQEETRVPPSCGQGDTLAIIPGDGAGEGQGW